MRKAGRLEIGGRELETKAGLPSAAATRAGEGTVRIGLGGGIGWSTHRLFRSHNQVCGERASERKETNRRTTLLKGDARSRLVLSRSVAAERRARWSRRDKARLASIDQRGSRHL